MTATADTIPLSALAEWLGRLDARLEESGGEITPEIQAELDEFLGAEGQKVDAYGFAIRALEAEAKVLKGHAREFAEKAAAREKRAEWLCDRMAAYLTLRGGERKLAGTIYTFAFQKNGGKEPVEVCVPPEELPEWAQRVKVEADVDSIRGLLSPVHPELKIGERLYARLLPRGEHLRLR